MTNTSSIDNAHIIPCPFCHGSAKAKDGTTCWFCEGCGQAFADHGEHVDHEEGCECAACVESRAEFNAWCDSFEERWRNNRTASA